MPIISRESFIGYIPPDHHEFEAPRVPCGICLPILKVLAETDESGTNGAVRSFLAEYRHDRCLLRDLRACQGEIYVNQLVGGSHESIEATGE